MTEQDPLDSSKAVDAAESCDGQVQLLTDALRLCYNTPHYPLSHFPRQEVRGKTISNIYFLNG
jgi:hypothetical protein